MRKNGWMALAGVCLMSGCGSLTGPPSITASRTFYNEVIHDTSSEQLLLNIVRAKNYETPNFIDVSEADATVSFNTGVNGGLAGIGAQPGVRSTTAGTIAGQVGAISGTFTYGDSALVRYAPVQGYPLIQQVSSPIAPESIVRMFNSDFGLADVLEFSVDRLAPGYKDNFVAQDRMVLLDQFGAIVLAADVEDVAGGHGRGHSGMADGLRGGGDDAPKQNLNVILHNAALHPGGGIAGSDCPFMDQARAPEATVAKLWNGLRQLYPRSAANVITLRGAASPNFFFTTRSAIGALKEGEVDAIHFASPQEAAQIRALNSAAPCRINANIFYFNPPHLTQDEVDVMWSTYLTDALFPRIDQDIRTRAIWRDTHRAFIIIEQSASAPENAYVSVNKRGIWYWIDNDDLVSKANFALLNEIVTIQAVPETRQPLTPSISVGR